MGSPSAVISIGLGAWATVNEVITLGYGSDGGISGPFRSVAGQAYSPGSVVGQGWQPGSVAGEAYNPGSVEGQGV